MSEHEPPVLVVTIPDVPGHRIVRTLGYVDGDAISSTSSMVKSLVRAASTLGANAVVGARWAIGDEDRSWIYGTAVVIEPEAS